nr:hypothetical protein [Tanacetum cinerariifolium]
SGTDEGTGSRPGVSDVPSDDSEEELSWNSFDDEDVDEQTQGRDKSKGDKTNESDDDDDNQDEAEKGNDDNDDEEEIYKIGEQEVTESDKGDDEATESDRESLESIFTIGSTTVTPIPSPQSTMTPSIILTFTTASQLPTPPTQFPSLDLQSLLTFTSGFHFEDKAALKAVQTQRDRLQDSIQRENDQFLKTIDENMKKIIKEQAEVLTRSSHSSRTSYAVAADLSEMELKKFLIEKMEGNKSIQRSDEQRNLYKAPVEAYDADKTIMESYGESVILKRRREDDDQEGPSAGSDRGYKRQREGGEHASASTPSEPATESAGRSTTGSQSRQLSASESAFAEEPVQTTCQMEEPSHPVFETGAEDQPIIQTTQHPEWFFQPRRPPTPDHDCNKTLPAAQGNAQSRISALAKQTDARSLFNELLDTPIDFSNFIMNRLGVDTLTLELLAGPTYELTRGCNSLTELEYHLEEVYKATTDQLDWVNPDG